MLLANATISQEGAEQLLQLGQAKLAGLHCAMLLQVSCAWQQLAPQPHALPLSKDRSATSCLLIRPRSALPACAAVHRQRRHARPWGARPL
jgi:hypothetical protein